MREEVISSGGTVDPATAARYNSVSLYLSLCNSLPPLNSLKLGFRFAKYLQDLRYCRCFEFVRLLIVAEIKLELDCETLENSCHCLLLHENWIQWKKRCRAKQIYASLSLHRYISAFCYSFVYFLIVMHMPKQQQFLSS